MLEVLALGCGFAFAAGVQPGPLQAFLLSRVAERGWRHTLPAAFAPLLSDGPIALVVLVVLKRLPAGAISILHLAGGALLLYLAGATYRRWRRRKETGTGKEVAAPPAVFQAALVNLLNPNPYLGWSLVLGPQVMKAWAERPANAVVLIAAFYATMAATLAMTIVLLGTTRFLGPAGRRRLILFSAVILALLGVYQLFSGLKVQTQPT